MNFITRHNGRIVILLLFISFFYQCGQKIDSHFMDNIVIDGETTEWRDKMTYFEQQAVSIGVGNDSRNIYLCFISGNNALNRRIFSTGFTTWFDIEGKKKQRFGIKFPLGIPPAEREALLKSMQQRYERSGRQTSFSNMLMSYLDLDQMEVIDSEGSKLMASINSNSYQIDINLEHQRGRLVYEMKVPIESINHTTVPFELNESRVIGVGLELNNKNLLEQRSDMSGSSGSNLPQYSAGTRGRERNRARSRRTLYNNRQTINFKTWMKVNLAVPDQAS